jgi:hypothetical protein
MKVAKSEPENGRLASPAPLRGGCKLGHEPIAIPLIKLLSLNKLFQQVDSCCGVMTFAFELGDDPILIVDLPPAEDNVLLGSPQKIKKRGTVQAMNPPGVRRNPPLHTPRIDQRS